MKNEYKQGYKQLLIFPKFTPTGGRKRRMAQEPWRWDKVKEREGIGDCPKCLSKASQKQTVRPLKSFDPRPENQPC